MSIAGEIEPVLAGPEEIRRRSILGEALKIFARFGFQKASMGQVARAAGLSRQGLYRHFSSKESLFRDSILFALQTSLAEAAAVLASRDLPLAQRILAALQAWVGKHIDEVGENYPELVEAVGLHVEPDRISDLLLGIPFFIPSAPFPPKARGRWGFDANAVLTRSPAGENKTVVYKQSFLWRTP